jgi:hypothetical protein
MRCAPSELRDQSLKKCETHYTDESRNCNSTLVYDNF